MIAYVTGTGYVLLALAAVCLLLFVLWIVIEGAVRDGRRKR